MRLSAVSVFSVSYLRQYGGCLLWCTLSLTCGRLTGVCRERVLCELLEVDWRLTVGVHPVIYTRQIGGCPHGAGVYSVIYIEYSDDCLLGCTIFIYMRDIDDCPKGQGYSVIYIRQDGDRLQRGGCVHCQLH